MGMYFGKTFSKCRYVYAYKYGLMWVVIFFSRKYFKMVYFLVIISWYKYSFDPLTSTVSTLLIPIVFFGSIKSLYGLQFGNRSPGSNGRQFICYILITWLFFLLNITKIIKNNLKNRKQMRILEGSAGMLRSSSSSISVPSMAMASILKRLWLVVCPQVLDSKLFLQVEHS